MTRSLPSSLIRSQSSGSGPERQRREPSAAERAMWTSAQLKSYYERKGEWGLSEEDQETVARFRQRGDSPW